MEIFHISKLLCGFQISAMRKVKVVDYQDTWNEEYSSEANALHKSIGFLNPTIHHIGSTSVPGLAAKPVIDILIEISDLSLLESHISNLEPLGYSCRGENGIPGRLYLEKGGDDRSHQIHVFKRGGKGALRHLAFRDYLRNHPHVANEYALLKKHVADTCNNDIERYCDGKDGFIKEHEKLAIEWYSHNKQMQSDAAKAAPLI